MTTDTDKMLKALRTAIEMEKDGKQWYLEASLKALNESGRLLLEALADGEDEHIRKFEQIYETIRKQNLWPSIDLSSDTKDSLRAQFDRACTNISVNAKPAAVELDIIETAVEKESKSCDFYNSLASAATGETERTFYEALSRGENEHHLILVDYGELMTDPAGWFLKKERQSLDGG
jgi:rubrerythrin